MNCIPRIPLPFPTVPRFPHDPLNWDWRIRY